MRPHLQSRARRQDIHQASGVAHDHRNHHHRAAPLPRSHPASPTRTAWTTPCSRTSGYAADVAISGATSSTYVLVSADEDNTIKVRVSFTDDEGNAETLTSAGTTATATAPTNTRGNRPADHHRNHHGRQRPDRQATSGISDANGLDNATFSYQWLRDDANISNATSSTYTVAGEDEAHTVKVQVSFTDDDGFSESVTSAGTAIPLVPLTGHFDANVPASHGGLNTTFTFQLYFSVNPSLGFTNVRDNVLDVTNGTVTYVRRTDPQGSARNSRWEITVQPSGDRAPSR